MQAAASGVAALTGDYVINGNELNLPDPAMRIQTYLNTFDKDDEWATIEWTIKLNGEDPVTFKGMTAPDALANANNASTDTIESIKAVVTSEDGSNIAIYRDADSNLAADAEALAKARAEAKDELKAALLTAIADEAEDESVIPARGCHG